MSVPLRIYPILFPSPELVMLKVVLSFLVFALQRAVALLKLALTEQVLSLRLDRSYLMKLLEMDLQDLE